MRKFLGLVVAALMPFMGILAFSSNTASPASPLIAPLLPGEPTLSGGATGVSNVPAYDFGVNNGIEYGNATGTAGFAEDPNAQATVKSANLGIDRIWAPYESTPISTLDANDTQWLTDHINAAKNSGLTCYLELGEVENLPFLESVINFAEPMGCHLFEFGNEIDSHSNYSTTTYVNQWNADIPQLRALSVCAGTGTVSSGCLFGGPTSIGVGGMQQFLSTLNQATAMPDFVSYHQYACDGAAAWDTTTTLDQEDCIQAMSLPAAQCVNNVNNCTFTSMPFQQNEVLQWEQQYLGKLIPTGVSETNFDPGTATLGDWANDDKFLSYYAQAAADTFVAEGASFSMTYTTEDSAGYGDLDLLCDGAGYNGDPACTAQGAPKGEFVGLACEAAMYGAQSTFVAPPVVASDSNCSPSNIGNWPTWTFPVSNPTAPSAPTGVKATAGDGQALVSWTAPNNGGSPITGYAVTASTGQTVTVTGTGATVTGLTDGTPVTFTVTATNSVGTGPASAPSNSVTPHANTVPDPPINVTATAGNASATVRWNAPANNGGTAILGYTVHASDGTTQSTTGLSLVYTGLTNGTSYTFTVTANNNIGQSALSAPSNAVTPSSVITTPTFVQAAKTHKSAVSSAAVTFINPVTAGDSIVVETGVWAASSPTAKTVTDSAGDVFTEVTHVIASDQTELAVWTATASTTGTLKVTATPTAKADVGVAALEYANLGAPDGIATASGTTTAATTVSSGVTPVSTGAGIAIGFYNDSGFGDSLGKGAAWTTRVNVPKTTNMEFLVEDEPIAAGGSTSATFKTGANTTWQAVTILFQ